MNKARVIIVGGGFSGIAAAVAASKAGAQTVLLERTDLLSGAGLRAGRLYHNGKIVACEENKALGGGEVVEALESIVLHRGNIIDEANSFVYNTGLVDAAMLKVLEKAGVELRLRSRAAGVEKENGSLKAVTTQAEESIQGDAFVDASGTFGGIRNCIRYGHGCVMCLHRCPLFGDRVSIATKAGAEELTWLRPGGLRGTPDPALALFKESLSPQLQARLKKEGAFSIPIPQELIDYSRLDDYKGLRGPREVSHVNLVDIGLVAKCVGMGYFPLASLRKVPGFENAQIEHPGAGGGHGFIWQLSITPRENSLQAKGFKNLFVAGEKTGVAGIAESIGTGALAGNNAARVAFGKAPMELPRSTAMGDIIALRGENMAKSADLRVSFSMAHGAYLERMKELGLFNTDPAAVRKRIEDLGLTGIFSRRLA